MKNIKNDSSKLSSKINISIKAIDKIYSLISEKNMNSNLRIRIISGGCNGLQYKIFLDQEIFKNDYIFTKKCSDGKSNIKLIIDAISFPYLEKIKIDYLQDIKGERFIIYNPIALSTCSCGESFNIF
ncbi:HesB/IscA family protein [Candidatus Legionella polyplacis]|uniref:Iron-sulfur cluster assembly accessory protein n=1 Tax=Candidatus Legionella polyplacis TaxID=2005262 RepID=A0ABZ2GXD1_9GAMM